MTDIQDAEFTEPGSAAPPPAKEAMPLTASNMAMVPTDNPFQQMAQLALANGQVDQLDKLLDLQLKWDAEKARKAFVAAMALFKTEPMVIEKTKLVSYKTDKGKTEYVHAELADVTRVIVPALAKHGLSHRWTVRQDKDGITVECILTHRDGHSEAVCMTAPADGSGGKNTIQAIASTKTYLERYTLLAATGVATGGEMDDDGRSYGTTEADFITEEQEIILRDLIDAYIINKPKFFAFMGVEKLSELRADAYDAVHNKLKEIRQEKVKKDAADGTS